MMDEWLADVGDWIVTHGTIRFSITGTSGCEVVIKLIQKIMHFLNTYIIYDYYIYIYNILV